MLRRLVSEVARDLPERIVISQAVNLTEAESNAYETVRLNTLAEYGGAAALVALNRLRMFSAHPMLLEDTPASLDAVLSFSKTKRLFEIVDEVFSRRQKVLVFTSYNRMADAIVRVVRERYGFYGDVINGSTPVEDRQRVVDSFSEHIGPGLLALNPRAAGAGLNITAATHVVHYNLEWNPAVEDQASARAHRRGQDRPVTIHRLFCADSVEEVVNERLDRKRGLASTAVVGVEGSEEDRKDIIRAMQLTPLRLEG
jgi:SNF2 family DNA or RNA helicase